MAKVGINTGSAANAGDGSALRAGANIINANFDEIYEYFGDGTTLDADLAGKWLAVSTGINTLSNIGIGTTNPWNALTVLGNASITGVTTSSGGFSGDITGTLTGNVYNTGISTFQDVLISGASTITGKSTFTGIGTFSSDLYVGGNLYTLGDITYDEVNGRNISVTGIGTVAYLGATDLNVSGFSTFSGLSTTGSDLFIGDSLYVSQDATILGVTTFSNIVSLPDDTSIILGDDDDLEIHHAGGSNSYIKNNTLALDIRGDTTNINSKNNSVTFLKANASGLMATTGVLTATSFEGDGSSLTGVAATDYIVSNSLKVLGISTFVGNTQLTATTASTSSATGALVVSGGVGIAGSLHVGENVSVGGTLTYEDVTNIDVIGIITARAGVLVNGGRGIDIAGGGLEVAGVTTLGTNVKIGSAVTFNNNSGINVTGIVTATGLNAGISVWTLGADGTDHYTFSGPGFTGTPGDPIIYLQRGQKYVFQNRSGGHPFRIQSTVNGSSGTAYSDGVTNNDAANGTDLVWNVQQDTPDVLYYQCTSHANMGGVIYIGNRFQSLQEPYDFWMFGG